ncbi:uncharacterized protein LOC120782198 [Bactrocera tryoni]|uniref:uncharacterized protein LOC120782198 n=1 Tax=Bactrocera tryoni TaxID=59916 RepID=UPI001A95B95C|nr:uncharacterized protein LOC120782198 [Bactrocera tryoni]
MRGLSLLHLALGILFCLLAADKFALALRINVRTTTPATTTANTEATSTPSYRPIIINNNIPNIDASCMVRYKCTAKLKGVTVAPRPCTKYCVKFIECPNAAKVAGSAGQCFELDEAALRQKYEGATKQGSTVPLMEVAMIDFPCRPGFLPDDLGRCREVW